MANNNLNGPYIVPPSASSSGGPLNPGVASPALDQLRTLSALDQLRRGSDLFDPMGSQLDDPYGNASPADDGVEQGSLRDHLDSLQQGHLFGPKTVDDWLREYDAIDPIDPDMQGQADGLQGQYAAGMRPSADALSALLSKGEPDYRPAHVSPWLVALGAGLGALQNSVEPHNQTGVQNWLADPLAQVQQSAQDSYMRARQGYASQLDNAKAQYGLAKDRNQTYLDRAQEIEDDLREHAARRAEYAARGISRDPQTTQQQKAEFLRQLLDSEQSRMQQEWQGTQNSLSALQDLRHGVVSSLLHRGDIAGVIHLLHSDYMEGRHHFPDGTPVDPNDAAALQEIHGTAMNSSPDDLSSLLGRRIADETARQVRMHHNSIRRQSERLQRILGSAFGQVFQGPTAGN